MNHSPLQKKINIRLPQEFYEILKCHAELAHLPPSTFIRKYLMENLIKDQHDT